jgi:hypothetical protein
LDQACGGVVRHLKVLPTGLRRLSKFPRIEASKAPPPWPNGCGQVVKGQVVKGQVVKGQVVKGQVVKGQVVKAVGTGNNDR